MGRIIARALLCGVAAVVGWIFTEPFLPSDIMDPAWAIREGIMVTVVVGLIGLIAGLHQGYLKGGTRNLLMGAALGFVFGSVGGQMGYRIGGGLAGLLFGPSWAVGSFPMVPRTIMGLFLGGLLGLGIGTTQFNWRPILAGLIGGLIGGGLAGGVFDPIAQVVNSTIPNFDGREEGGTASRAIFWTLIGINVGLFTALVENATRQAWVRLVLGRNEGREWPIDAAQTNIGRDERAHVPLFGDQNVAPLHAVIAKDGNNYILHDPGSQIGVGLNGQRLSGPAYLNAGDTINIGNHQLQFLMKAGAARKAQEGRPQAYKVGGPSGAGQMPQQQMPQQPMTQPMPNQTQAYTQTQMPQQPQMQQPMGNQTQAYNPQQMPGQPQLQPTGGRSLVVTSGPMTGQRFDLNHPIDVGREAQGIPLGYDTQASRRHAQVSPSPDGVQVQDLGSTNGTFVNGNRIDQAVARPGDTIQIGGTQFRVE